MTILDALKGPRGEFEINRIVGAAGVMTYVIAAPVFVAWDMARGHAFDVALFCASYPAGLGVAIGAVAGAVAIKDRNVATARVTNAQADQTEGQRSAPQ
jgi:hypothetical protein